MQLDSLKPHQTRKVARRIGRGGKRGKMSGRGHKGQTARAGNSMRPEMREIIKKIPKLRGHGINRSATVNEERVLPTVINLNVIDAAFKPGDEVTPASLMAAGLIGSRRKKLPKVKILGTGVLTKKLVFKQCQVSGSAKTKIEQAGGTVS